MEISNGTKLYVSDGEGKPLPAPHWDTLVSLVDTTIGKVSPKELDPKLVTFVLKQVKIGDRKNLKKKFQGTLSFPILKQWNNAFNAMIQI